MGGSIGLALQERGLAGAIVGIGRRQASLDRALACGAITRATLDLEAGVAQADVVIVATPVASVVEDVCRVLAALPAGGWVIDVGSTKASLCAAIEAHQLDSSRFIGCHPLAGDHRSGPEHARADLFVGKVVVGTPTAATSAETTAQATAFWEALGARWMTMTPAAHDQALATTSHLPHLVASALAAGTPQAWLPLTATGWADTTRIAAGDPQLWTQIFAENRADVSAALHLFIQQLQAVERDLGNQDDRQLEVFLQQAKQARDALGN
jgi:prephenate dehydrogenase